MLCDIIDAPRPLDKVHIIVYTVSMKAPLNRILAALLSLSFIFCDATFTLPLAVAATDTVATPSRFSRLLAKQGLDIRLSDALFTTLKRLRRGIVDGRPLPTLVREFNDYFRALNTSIPNKIKLKQIPGSESDFPTELPDALELFFDGIDGPTFSVVIPTERRGSDQEYDQYLALLGIKTVEDYENFKLLDLWLIVKKSSKKPVAPPYLDELPRYTQHVQDIIQHDSPRIRRGGDANTLYFECEQNGKTVSTPWQSATLAKLWEELGLKTLPLRKSMDSTAEQVADHVAWINEAAMLAARFVSAGDNGYVKLLGEFGRQLAQKNKDKINAKAVTIDQIERDFADPTTAAIIEKELKAGMRYLVITPVGEDPKDSATRLARGNFIDKNWFYDPQARHSKEGKIHILQALDRSNPSAPTINVSDVVSKFREELAADLGLETIGDNIWKAYVENPDEAYEVTNFVAAFDKSIVLRGPADRIRHLTVEPGTRMSEILTLLQGLFTMQYKEMIKIHRADFVAAGYTDAELNAILATSGDHLSPMAATASQVNHLTELKSRDVLVNWAA